MQTVRLFPSTRAITKHEFSSMYKYDIQEWHNFFFFFETQIILRSFKLYTH